MAACTPKGGGRTTQTPPRTPAPAPAPAPDPRPVDPPVVVAPPAPTPPPKPTEPKQGTTPAEPRRARLALMMPLFGDDFERSGKDVIPERATWGLTYYAGLRLALEDLEREGMRAEVHVFDTRGDAGVAQRLVSDVDVLPSDALIAPYLTDAVRSVVEPAQLRGIPVIVPFSAAPDLVDDYPQLLQLNPGLPTHLDALAAHLHATYSPEQVVLIGLPTGEQNGAVAYLKNLQRTLAPNGPPWRTWRLESSDDAMTGLEWDGKFVDGKETVFVFPIYNRPELINGFMSQLRIHRRGRPTVLAGMPQWADFAQLDPSMLETHSVVVTTGPRVDWEAYDVLQFADRYAAAYGTLPDLPAFLGYDAARLTIPLIDRHGREWTEHLPQRYAGLASNYLLRARYKGEAPTSTPTAGNAERQPSFYENTDVRVLRFSEGSFKPVAKR